MPARSAVVQLTGKNTADPKIRPDNLRIDVSVLTGRLTGRRKPEAVGDPVQGWVIAEYLWFLFFPLKRNQYAPPSQSIADPTKITISSMPKNPSGCLSPQPSLRAQKWYHIIT
jgi:hypothetical protein